MTSLYSHIILVLFKWVIKQDFKKKIIATGDSSQSNHTPCLRSLAVKILVKVHRKYHNHKAEPSQGSKRRKDEEQTMINKPSRKHTYIILTTLNHILYILKGKRNAG